MALSELHQVHELPVHDGQQEADAGLPHLQLAVPLRLPGPVGEADHAIDRERVEPEVAEGVEVEGRCWRAEAAE